MTTAVEDQLTAFGERSEGAEALLGTTQPVDMGLLVTMNSRMHCRMPMERIDPAELPIRQPVYVDGDGMVPLGMAPAGSGNVVTYRCACGFTIDDPATSALVSEQALAS
ncbi:hypothetical protein FDW83_10865 [Pseudarthrobacter sp. NamE2]|uniref:hypothetical protein n=1 Tax=Pseudarthrobacter sp. NamE2 TaxID=2576838 RepID=UPI0010FF5C00|nr:hypothetical protein [Pseudarthrobacter sp. NamE2]TLM82898.1 hypothetical protein FDW83_10865 [Pseudarthrobacter sp. NamE2]